jgi:uncharacterized protein YjiS (DUF1127 family)
MNAVLKSPSILWLPLVRVGSRLVRALAPRRRAGPRPGADELRAMGERELRDLGIGRCEIPHLLETDRVRRGR